MQQEGAGSELQEEHNHEYRLLQDLPLSQEILDEVDRRLKSSPPEKAEEILKQVVGEHESLKYHLLGPSLTKAGQDTVNQQKVSEVIYNASKGSKFFNNEEVKDKVLTQKIERILGRKAHLEKLDLSSELRRANDYITELELSRDLSQTIVHIDCDAFYAAVEELDRPELKNVPFAVGKGVLTTCNYEARKYGCRSAMAGFVAKKLCPQIVLLPLNFDKYSAKAKEVREILAEYDERFESASIDEAYLNITQYCVDHQIGAEEAVSQLRHEVAEKTKITISAGIAANAKIAKIASNKNKPNGQCFVPSERSTILTFMRELPVRKVNGVGRVFERELRAIGIENCGDIYDQRQYLTRLFGEKASYFLLQTYLGLGRTSVQPAEDYERKSIGTESTFRDKSGPELYDQLRHTAEELEKDLTRTQFKGRTLVLKIKLHNYEVFTRQVAPPKAVSTADDLYKYAVPMLAKLEKDMPNLKLRLMGLRCTHLISTKKPGMDFFGPKSSVPQDKVLPRQDSGNDEGEWEVWPEAEFEAAARQEKQDEMNDLERFSQEAAEQEHISASPNKQEKGTKKLINGGVFWDCPICGHAQAAEDATFNAHIDLCLSRQTIKEVVQDTTEAKDVRAPKPSVLAARSKSNSNVNASKGTKRKGVTKLGVPEIDSAKRKKLFFG